jgi:lipopolysaccharide export system protein LptC
MGRVAQTFFGLILFAGFACGPKKKAPAAPSAGGPSDQSNFKMYDLHIQSFVNTRLSWDVRSPLGEMFTNNNAVRLHRMQALTYDDNGHRAATVSSDLALLATGPNPKPINNIALNDGDAYLADNVVMVSTDGSKVMTDWARYSKKDDLITSTAPVKVIREDSITNGVGMEARADMSDLKIFNQTLLIRGTDEDKP